MAENLKPIQGVNTITKAWKLESHSDNRYRGKYQASFFVFLALFEGWVKE